MLDRRNLFFRSSLNVARCKGWRNKNEHHFFLHNPQAECRPLSFLEAGKVSERTAEMDFNGFNYHFSRLKHIVGAGFFFTSSSYCNG